LFDPQCRSFKVEAGSNEKAYYKVYDSCIFICIMMVVMAIH